MIERIEELKETLLGNITFLVEEAIEKALEEIGHEIEQSLDTFMDEMEEE